MHLSLPFLFCQFTTFSVFFSPPLFILDFATTLFVSTKDWFLNPATSSNPRDISNKMRQYHMVSGILLILSIIDSALAAPLMVREKRQTGVDAVMLNIPKDVITVLAKRGEEEDIAMLAGKYLKKLKSSAPSSSTLTTPTTFHHWSANVPQAPPVNWKHLMNIDYGIPPVPKWRPSVVDFTKLPMKSKPTDGKYSSSTSLGDLLQPPKDVGQAHESQQGQQEELLKNGENPEESAGAHSASPSSTPPEPDDGSTSLPQPPMDWEYLMNKDYHPPFAPARPSSSKGPDFTRKHFPENMHEMEPPKGVGQAHESHGQQPNAGPGPSDPGPSNAKPSNSRPTTTLDSSTGLGVKRPLPPPTDSERATMGHRPPSPPADPDLWLSPTLTPTEVDSYNPGWVVYSPLLGTWSPTIPEHGVWTPPLALPLTPKGPKHQEKTFQP